MYSLSIFFSMPAVKYKEVWSMYKKSVASFWTVEEVYTYFSLSKLGSLPVYVSLRFTKIYFFYYLCSVVVSLCLARYDLHCRIPLVCID